MKKLLLAAVCMLGLALHAEIQVKNGERIAFLGDSITYYGAATGSGYCRLVIAALAANRIEAVPVFAGVSGHKSNQMLERLEADVISKHPQWMLLSCGVNDVWHGEKGVPLDAYKKNITAIVDKARAANIRVVILTSTMIGEDADNDNNRKLEEYNAFLRRLAAEKSCLLADAGKAMKSRIAAETAAGRTAGTILTVDGVHMNPLGNMLMAASVLEAIGFSPEQLALAGKTWESAPGACEVHVAAGITISDYEKLDAAARERNITVQEMLDRMLASAVGALPAPAANAGNDHQ